MTIRKQPPGRLAAGMITVVALLLFGCQGLQHTEIAADSESRTGFDPLNTVYLIDNREVRLVNGEAIQPTAPDSSSQTVTRVWGEPLAVDLDRDGAEDAVLILTQTTGGSGTFYFVAAAIAKQGGYEGTAGLFLGDRIAPEPLATFDAGVRIAYLARDDDEPFAAEPTVPQRKQVIYEQSNRGLVEVAIDFEGEADPGRMTLQMQTWRWVKTVFNDDTLKQPAEPGFFTLTFAEDGRVSGTTDCNRFQGTVTIERNRIQFAEDMAMTRMFCADSQEQAFVRMLQNVRSFFFTSHGELIMELRYDSGSMFFR